MTRRQDLTATAFASLRNMQGVRRKSATQALARLGKDPEPDGRTRRELPFPYRPGTCGALYEDFLILYTLTEEALVILDVQVVVSAADEWLDDD